MGDSSRGSEWAHLPCVLHGRACSEWAHLPCVLHARACSASMEPAAATWVPDDARLRWATAPAARNGHISRAYSTGALARNGHISRAYSTRALAPPAWSQLQPRGSQMMLDCDGRQLPRLGMGTSPVRTPRARLLGMGTSPVRTPRARLLRQHGASCSHVGPR